MIKYSILIFKIENMKRESDKAHQMRMKGLVKIPRHTINKALLFFIIIIIIIIYARFGLKNLEAFDHPRHRLLDLFQMIV